MSKRFFFYHDIGNIYHYGHFIVDVVLPFANFLHTHGASFKEVCLKGDNHRQSLGAFVQHFEFIFAPLRVRYLSEPEWDERSDPAVSIQGYQFGPYPQVALDALAHRVVRHIDTNQAVPIVDIVVVRRKYVPVKIYSDSDNNEVDLKTGSLRRSLDNHEKVLKVVREFGARHHLTVGDIALEEMDIKEQIRLFSEASIIIGQHGAGMCNLAFSHPTMGKQSRKLASVHVLEISYWGLDTVKYLCEAQQAKHYLVESTKRRCDIASLKECLAKTIL